MDDSLALPAPECTFAHEGPRESRGSEGRSATGTEVAPIDFLPNELLLVIFELYTGQDTPARNLVALSLVCKLWRDLVEGTITVSSEGSSDGQGCPTGDQVFGTGRKDRRGDLFAEIGGRIAQWKSLDVGATKWNPVLASLKQANTPKLKTLNLRAPWGHELVENVVTLFGGEPASVALKDLHVESIPLAIAPLRLSRLRSLELQGAPIVSTEEVLRVLRGSPGLKQCDLIHLTCLRNAGFALPSHILDYPAI
ncbi:hypothetical protein FRC05_002862 [Tulasnella sp. 425]|nr:hypothetical protein FRC05_002862 [Tulasnella sp. 425]